MSNTGCRVQKYRVKMDKIKRIKEQIQGQIAFYSDLYSESRNKDYAMGLIDGMQTALRIINETLKKDE